MHEVLTSIMKPWICCRLDKARDRDETNLIAHNDLSIRSALSVVLYSAGSGHRFSFLDICIT